jgi:hypothetical protein
MISIFTNRELSKKFGINLAKWKRWSREFIAPDPLAGLQSGYARQYYLNDAFRIYLGGHLVSDLKFSVPDAVKILADLDKWLDQAGFCFDIKGETKTKKGLDALVDNHSVLITKETENCFRYCARGLISRRQIDHKGFTVWEEVYSEKEIQSLRSESSNSEKSRRVDPKMLYISSLHRRFKTLLSAR